MSEEKQPLYAYAHFEDSIFSIQCGKKHGTGWLFLVNASRSTFKIGTAAHVVSGFMEQGESITITHYKTGNQYCVNTHSLVTEKPAVVKELDYAFMEIEGKAPGKPIDIQFEIVSYFKNKKIPIPNYPLGMEVAWIGFPSTTYRLFGRPVLTMHGGTICAVGRHEGLILYCVDGNVNRGMSGSPVFKDDGAVIGIVSEFAGTCLDERDEITDSPTFAYPGIGVVRPIAYFMAAFIQDSGGWEQWTISDEGSCEE